MAYFGANEMTIAAKAKHREVSHINDFTVTGRVKKTHRKFSMFWAYSEIVFLISTWCHAILHKFHKIMPFHISPLTLNVKLLKSEVDSLKFS